MNHESKSVEHKVKFWFGSTRQKVVLSAAFCAGLSVAAPLSPATFQLPTRRKQLHRVRHQDFHFKSPQIHLGPLIAARALCAATFKDGNILKVGPWKPEELMLDTGAQLNAIHPDAVARLNAIPATGPTVALQGVDGDSTASEFVVLAVRFPGSAACIVPFLVVPHLPRAAMLGQAFLTASKAVVDLGAGTVRLSGISQPLVGSRPAKPSKKSEAVLSVIITPSSELTKDITPCTLSAEADTRPADETVESADPGEATLQDARPPPGLTLDAVTNALNELPTPALSVEERASVLALLGQHKALWLGDPRGTLVAYHHRVVVTTDHPVRCGPRRFTPEEREVQKKELAAMLDAGVVRVSHSPHVSEVVMINVGLRSLRSGPTQGIRDRQRW